MSGGARGCSSPPGRPGLAAALAALLTAVAIVACGAADEPPHVACRALGEPADRAPGAGRLAVVSDPDGSFEFDGDQSDLYLLNADGSGRRRLTTARGNDFTPAWSPDGTQIAFRSNRDREHALDPNDELYVICADGSHERRLTTTPDIQERSPPSRRTAAGSRSQARTATTSSTSISCDRTARSDAT